MEMKTLSAALDNCCEPYNIKIVDTFNYKIASVNSSEAKEKVKRLFGHLTVVREGTHQGRTAFQVIR